MPGPKRSSGVRTGLHVRNKWTNRARFDPFDGETFGAVIYDSASRPALVLRLSDTEEVAIYERPLRPGFLRPCSALDTRRFLETVPLKFLRGLRAIHLLGGTSRQLAAGRQSRWGCYALDGSIHIYAYPERRMIVRWKRTPRPHILQEYMKAGVELKKGPDGCEARFTRETLRAFILWNVLLHELGHHVDRIHGPRDRRAEEGYANWFAAEWARELARRGIQELVDDTAEREARPSNMEDFV